jgi:shikimate kinase
MGAGKSFIGEHLAQRLGLAFVDIDREIEQDAGMTVAEIFAHQGEAAFRLLEEQTLAKLLKGAEPAVIATGGGCVLAQANRQQLQDHCWVVYLQVSGPVAMERCMDRAQVRPLLQSEDPLVRWEAITHERQIHYSGSADATVNTDGQLAQALVDQIVAEWEQVNGKS